MSPPVGGASRVENQLFRGSTIHIASECVLINDVSRFHFSLQTTFSYAPRHVMPI